MGTRLNNRRDYDLATRLTIIEDWVARLENRIDGAKNEDTSFTSHQDEWWKLNRKEGTHE